MSNARRTNKSNTDTSEEYWPKEICDAQFVARFLRIENSRALYAEKEILETEFKSTRPNFKPLSVNRDSRNRSSVERRNAAST